MANYFSILLVILTVVTGIVWLLDKLFWAPRRAGEVPYWVDTSEQVFPVIAFVLVLRTLIYEPFQIPSGSMMPTLLVGDFILVEKFAYGLKDPVLRHKFVDTGKPERGDIVVFKYPQNPNVDYIKRVIGLPGDTVVYQNKQVFIRPKCTGSNEQVCKKLQPVPLEFESRGEFVQNMAPLLRYEENLGKVSHDILRHPTRNELVSRFYTQPGTRSNEWLVPEDEYFVMGDNRDNSRDSRYWGFVPDANLVGKAVAIWVSFEFERKAEDILPTWIPTGIRFERIGGIQ
ncbi:signal peptidase I [Salinimonas chungwhensis]|uniref:signal peptidase I n=1 Tax=Salinimonas chungwhensis TaxID=265425 RepID=UPI0003727063|nr:signal peptidase I [Salinimonas chungwhensis]